jgi:hypothetical protein
MNGLPSKARLFIESLRQSRDLHSVFSHALGNQAVAQAVALVIGEHFLGQADSHL